MKHDKYVAYDADSNEYETFDSFEKAKEWLIDYVNEDGYITSDLEAGFSYIAKITHRIKFIKTDEKSNYTDDNDPWPYPNDMDYVGELQLEEI